MDDLTGRTELHRLLGLPRHLPADELRWAYERAMEAATRSGNMRHAMDLLKAYEALSQPRRAQLYGRAISADSIWSTSVRQSSEAGARNVRRRSKRCTAKAVRERKFGMALWARLLVYIVIAPATLLAIIESTLHPGEVASPNYGTRPQQPAVQQVVAPAATAAPEPSYPTNARFVPADTPVDSQGYVAVDCTPEPVNVQKPGYGLLAKPGEVVSCTNGAIPTIVK